MYAYMYCTVTDLHSINHVQVCTQVVRVPTNKEALLLLMSLREANKHDTKQRLWLVAVQPGEHLYRHKLFLKKKNFLLDTNVAYAGKQVKIYGHNSVFLFATALSC